MLPTPEQFLKYSVSFLTVGVSAGYFYGHYTKKEIEGVTIKYVESGYLGTGKSSPQYPCLVDTDQGEFSLTRYNTYIHGDQTTEELYNVLREAAKSGKSVTITQSQHRISATANRPYIVGAKLN